MKTKTWLVLGGAALGLICAVALNFLYFRTDKKPNAPGKNGTVEFDPQLQRIQLIVAALQREYDTKAPKPSPQSLKQMHELAGLGPNGQQAVLPLYDAWLRRMYDANLAEGAEFRDMARNLIAADPGAPKRAAGALRAARQQGDRLYQARLLVTFGNPSVTALCEASAEDALATGKDFFWAARSPFPQFVANFGADAVAPVCASLQHSKAAVRRQSLRTLALMAPEHAAEALPSIEEASKDPDPSVRAFAALALQELARPAPAVSMLESLLTDPDPLVQLVAARGLARHPNGDRQRVGAIVTELLKTNAFGGTINTSSPGLTSPWWNVVGTPPVLSEFAIWKGSGSISSYSTLYWDEVAAHVLLELGRDQYLPPEDIVKLLRTCPHDGRHLATLLASHGSRAKAAVPELARMATDVDYRQRRKAIIALGKIGHSMTAEVIPVLAAALSHEDGRTRWLAFLALTPIDRLAAKTKLAGNLHGAIDQAAAPFKRESLTDVVKWTRLNWHGTPAFLLPVAEAAERAPLTEPFHTPTDLDVIEERQRIDNMLAALQKAQQDSPSGGLGKDAVPFLLAFWQGNSRHPVTRAYYGNQALKLLAREGSAAESAVPHLIKSLSQYSSDETDKQLIPNTLLSIGEPALQHLARVLDDPHKMDQHVHVLEVFQHFGPRARPAVPSLVKALQAPSQDVRLKAVETFALLESAGKDAVPELRLLLKSDRSEIQRHAADALGLIGAEAQPAVPDLIALFDGDNEQLRVVAMRAISLIGKQAVTPLIGAIKDSREKVRLGAVRTLARMNAEDAQPALVALQQLSRNDPSEAVREVARDLVKELEKK